MKRKNCRKIYEKAHGKIPKGYEVHHIIPIFAGGTNKLNNLEILSPKDHAKKHLKRYKKYGDYRDLCSYYLIGHNFSIAHEIRCSNAGKIGGKIVKEKKIGIFRSKNDRKKWASMGGKAAQKTLKEKQISAFYDPELKKEICSKGGKNGAFTQSKWQSEFGKRNKGFKWYNDGVNIFKYTLKMQKELSFEDFLSKNKNFRKGTNIKWKLKE